MISNPAVKRIGVLTSGGDAPGMNAAIRAVVRTAQCYRIDCVGICHGYVGLMSSSFIPLCEKDVKGLTGRGGTVLYTARSKEFQTEDGVRRAAEACKFAGIEGIVVIGGDGSLRGALNLADAGVDVAGIPCTIDNDVGCTTYTIGFDTACNTAIEAVDKLNDTMQSHARCSVVEVMGRNAGHLALSVGIATGATITILPEVETDFEHDVIEHIRKARLSGRNHYTVIVAEGTQPVHVIAERINEATGIETRVTTLGHLQRGGSPLMRDRTTATTMGHRAVTLLAEGRGSRVVAMSGDECIDIDIHEAVGMTKQLDFNAYNMLKSLTFLENFA